MKSDQDIANDGFGDDKKKNEIKWKRKTKNLGSKTN